MPDLGLFASFIVQQVRALVLDHQHAAIVQLADEIRVEVILSFRELSPANRLIAVELLKALERAQI